MRACSNIDCEQINPQPQECFGKGKAQCKHCISKYFKVWKKSKSGILCITKYRNKYSRSLSGKKTQTKADKKWRSSEEGKSIYNSISASYRAKKINATPKWLSEEHKETIREFYKEATELSWLSEGGLAVDHIVPLQGNIVSGLHVPWNLQILPNPMNCSKSNRFTE